MVSEAVAGATRSVPDRKALISCAECVKGFGTEVVYKLSGGGAMNGISPPR